jgi:chorismate lyase
MSNLPCQNDVNQQSCPPGLKSWMHARDSLTQKLGNYSKDIAINLISNDWQHTLWWDNHVLGLSAQNAFIREITMCVGKKPWWYARTVIPQATFAKKSVLFSQLKKHSLGSILFTDDDIKRIDLLYYPVNHNHIEYHWALKSYQGMPKLLWSRRTVFSIEKQMLFLMEVFLPPMLDVVCND